MGLRALAALLAVFVSTASAESIVFDFEGQPLGPNPGGVVLSKDGYTISITRASGGFEFVDLSPFSGPEDVPVSWGARTLSPFTDFTDPTPFVLTVISVPVGMAILDIDAEYGDFTPSDLDFVFFDSTNAFLENDSDPGIFATASASAIDSGSGEGGKSSIDFSGGSDGQRQSLFWDNITLIAVAVGDLPMGSVAPVAPDTSDPTGGPGGIPVGDPIPEPGTLGLCAVAVAALVARRRRRRR